MNDKVKTIQDLSIYPPFFQELIRYMDKYNLSNHQAAKKLGIDRCTLDTYMKNPELIPCPNFFTGYVKLLPDKSSKLIQFIKEGKRRTNHNGYKSA